jgi:integrase
MGLKESNVKGMLPGEILRDPKIRGLHLIAKPTGKVFFLYYRTKGGLERRPKLGTYGSITLAQAREAAQKLLTRVAAGEDPSKASQDAKNEKTLTDLWDEFRKRKGAKKKSEKEDERLWNKKCQSLATKRLSEITYSAMADLHESISEDAPTSANRTLALLSTMFNFAVKPLDWIEKNPCEGVERNKETRRRRYMTMDEAAGIHTQLEAREAAEPAGVAFIWLLILTGARRGEIAKATWGQLHGNALVLEVHKTDGSGNDRIIHLSQAALDVLAKLPKTTGTLTGVESPRTLWETIREKAGCTDLRLHDLRHSFASAGISAGLTLAQIGELLGHHNTQTTQRYSHLMDEAAATAATSTTDAIMARMRPRTEAQPPETQSIQ